MVCSLSVRHSIFIRCLVDKECYRDSRHSPVISFTETWQTTSRETELVSANSPEINSRSGRVVWPFPEPRTKFIACNNLLMVPCFQCHSDDGAEGGAVFGRTVPPTDEWDWVRKTNIFMDQKQSLFVTKWYHGQFSLSLVFPFVLSMASLRKRTPTSSSCFHWLELTNRQRNKCLWFLEELNLWSTSCQTDKIRQPSYWMVIYF